MVKVSIMNKVKLVAGISKPNTILSMVPVWTMKNDCWLTVAASMMPVDQIGRTLIMAFNSSTCLTVHKLHGSMGIRVQIFLSVLDYASFVQEPKKGDQWNIELINMLKIIPLIYNLILQDRDQIIVHDFQILCLFLLTNLAIYLNFFSKKISARHINLQYYINLILFSF